MARGGQNVKPTKELKANGTFRPAYHANRVDVPVLDGIPPAPKLFDAAHRKKWDEVCGKLHKYGLLTKNDLDAVAVFVQTWEMAAESLADIQKNGMTLWIESAGGSKPVTNPAFRQYMECQKLLKPLFEQFGFTPRSRMGLKVEKPATEDGDLLDFLNN